MKLFWLLDRQVGGFGSLENLIDVHGGATKQVGEVRAIGDQTTGFHGLSIIEHRRQAVFYSELSDLASLSEKKRIGKYD